MEETWKDIVGYEGLYEISNTGKVRNAKTKFERKQSIHHTGYWRLTLIRGKGYEKKLTTISTHILLAKAFIPNPANKPQVNHIDGDKLNNSLDNLEWVTNGENQIHAYAMGLQKRRFYGTKNPKNKLTDEQALAVFNSTGHRRDVAEEFGISVSQYEHIKRGRSWSHLTGKYYGK